MALDDLDEMDRRFDGMTLPEKLGLIEHFVRRLRREFTAPEFERQMREMANDPDVLRELRTADLGGGPLSAAG
jgi:hypothetical protein